MAYHELMKDYERIRDYMREFFVYGFKSREEYTGKSSRSYDNERRRIESWLGDYMFFRQTANGKNVFLSVDSRKIPHNPLYKAFKAKTFTDKDICLHFMILDILAEGEALSVGEMVMGMEADYLSHFEKAPVLEESTLRKKLKEYVELGLLRSERTGREVRYSLAENNVALGTWLEAIAFFSEENPVGVIGSFLLDRFTSPPTYFRFKHHYILHGLDSEVLCVLLTAMAAHQKAELTIRRLHDDAAQQFTVYPLKIYASTQTGRQYLLCYRYEAKKIGFIRVDNIRKVLPGETDADYSLYQCRYEQMQPHLWGVSLNPRRCLEHIEMTVRIGKDEDYILRRLEREKRCGRVEQAGEGTWKYIADVYSAAEMLPWIRTFIGRIECLECGNQQVLDTFYADLAAMQKLYGGDDDDI